MLPTDILMHEHRIIERVLSCLTKIAIESESNSRIDEEGSRDAVDFLRNFADKCHHGKEEVHLFPAIESRGIAGGCGPTHVMRIEHDEGRAHVRAMAEAIEEARKGDKDAPGKFASHARAFVALLRDHIQKEDLILYPMANDFLTDEDQRNLMALFEKVESEEMGAGIHEKYLGIADRLAERYGVSREESAAVDKGHNHFCCGH